MFGAAGRADQGEVLDGGVLVASEPELVEL